MSHFTDYLKTLMADVTITNAQLLIARRDLRSASSTNGLTSVKLHRIRQRLEHDAVPVLKAWEEIDARHAAREADGKAKVKLGGDETGNPLFWGLTGTPAYVCDPEQGAARLAALTYLDGDEITLSVPLLTESDLAWITSEKDIGQTLALFTEPA